MSWSYLLLIPSFPVLFLTQVSPATLALLFILVNRCILTLGNLHMLFWFFFFKTNFRVTTYSRFTCFSCLCDYNIFFLVLRTTNCLLWKPGTQYIISNFTMKYWLNWIEHGIKGAKSVTEGHTELIVEKEMCPDLLIPSQVPGPFLTPYRN